MSASQPPNDKSPRIPAVFIDRDGTLNEDIGYVSNPEELVVFPWAAQAVRLVNEAGWLVVVITNQSGIARGMYTEATLSSIHSELIEKLAEDGARIDAIYYCPHHPSIGNSQYRKVCECRKPQTGMLTRAARDLNIDITRSFVVGDKASDMKLAENAGARGALVLTGYGRATLNNSSRWPCSPEIVSETLLEAVKAILDT